MLRRFGIRAKVMAVLAVPMIVLLVAGVYISYGAVQKYQDASAAQAVIKTLDAYKPLSAAIENERVVTITGGSKEEVAAARAATDKALSEVRDVTKDLDLGNFPPTVVRHFTDVQESYNTNLPDARAAADNGLAGNVAYNYAAITTGELDLVDEIGQVLTDREVGASISAFGQIQLLSNRLISEMINGLQEHAGDSVTTLTGATYQAAVNATEQARSGATLALNRLDSDIELPAGDPTSRFTQQRLRLTSGSQTLVNQLVPEEYLAEVQAQQEHFVSTSDQVLAQSQKLAAADVSSARSTALLTIAIVIAAAILSLLFALFVARTIVTPLRRLTSAASNVREQLPRLVEQVATPGEGPEITIAPIPVTSMDEVGRLAAAFNSVNATTVSVAQEQAALRGSIAEMFVNVARRDQVLLNRQLSFIDSLERSEEDPSTLANLFRLDHLATRMRRNAESLLVLAGIDSGRRLRDAMPLSDVIRTASSEIEQYDRVELDLQTDPHMLGFNALGAAHLLAELLENATVFSEPETPVTVSTGINGQFVAVRIVDHGLGMTDAEIEAANVKIASTGAGDMLGAQRLGLFVVGRIAQRLGAAVQLAKSTTGTGTETTVLFPAHLFAVNETSMYGSVPDSAAELTAIVEAEAPVAEEVNLAALTDGETSLGLPRRRRGEGEEPSADSAPIPVPSIAGMPTRPRKTFDEDNLVLPDAPDGNLSADFSSATASDWSPATVAPGAGGLPSRTRAGTSAWQNPDEAPAASAAPASPAARAGLFSGFRGRSAADEAETGTESAPADNVRAPWMGLGGAHAAPEAPIVVPGLADDDDEPWVPTSHDEVAQTPVVAEPAAEWAGPEVAEPAAEWTTPEVAEPAEWAAPEVAEPAAEWAAPEVAEPAAEWAAPEVAEPAAEWAAPEVAEPAAEWTTPEVAEPAAEWTAPEVAAPVAEWTTPEVAEPAEQWTAPEVAAPVAEWTAPEVPEPAEQWTAPEVAEPAAEWTAPEVAEPAAEWTAPEVAEPAEQWTAPEVAAPVVAPTRAFTSYSGYSGWTARRAAAQPEDADFERTLDEARAWHTGAIETVPEPAAEPVAEASVVEAPLDAAPAWPIPTWDSTPSWADETPAPADEPVVEEPVAEQAAPVQDEPVAAPVAEEPAWAPTTPAWADHNQVPALVEDDATQLFTPVEATAAVEPLVTRRSVTSVEDVEQPVEQNVAQPAEQAAPVFEEQASPEAPAFAQQWAPTSVGTAQAPEGFADVVAPAGTDRGKKRWGLFGRRKSDEVVEQPAAQAPVTPDPVVRSSAWAQPAAPAVEEPAQQQSAPSPAWAGGWNAPAAPEAAPVAPPAAAAPAAQPSWTAPEWAARPAAGGAAPLSSVPTPSLPPSVAPRIGTLDDDVAAMLALRSDIQEQALSELSQLSAYRPSTVAQSERLTKRVPTSVPASTLGTEESATPVQRDAAELRSRLSNFQSGTSRGRRAAGDSAEQSNNS
ncbi:HAMP domain-containing protein [Cellulomonas sp. JH27-2]|uniref:ATP-binding protein n=1 Tax=Cellulomonas sp. JH27-2 TaxID=2774139 RepID=UPI00178459AE|nr:ATP-binding protein [Cellulomonas sp. JH27-2]MBD8059253.1 HAMP domain-containing protein [Cellulomonas sp. JH27-2]